MIHQVEQVLIWRLILHVLSFYQLNDLNSRWLLTCDVPPPQLNALISMSMNNIFFVLPHQMICSILFLFYFCYYICWELGRYRFKV